MRERFHIFWQEVALLFLQNYKVRREYREERMETYGYSSHSSESSQTSASSGSSSSGSETCGSVERKRKHSKKKSKYKREKKKRSESDDENEYIERERKKRRKHTKHRDLEEMSEDEEYVRSEERKHRSRKHKHHHRKHKHKHRRHRRHRSEEEYQERRKGGSVERSDYRREREEWEEKKYDKIERDSRTDRESERKNRKEEKRQRERGESRQVKSKWEEDDEAQYYSSNKRIKPDPDAEDTSSNSNHSRVKQEGDRHRKRQEREASAENGRPSWGTSEEQTRDVQEENDSNKEEMHKPNMALSGKLSEDANTFNGVVIKYSQPPEARKPKRRWRWYIFKGEEDLPFLPLHRQSAYLIGRDRKVADIPTDHPSCSKQHAVLQYRLVTYEREDGTKGRTVKPYILDLESANGTYVNNRRIDPRRFVELLEKDVVKFGYSSREYILLHEGSKGDDADAPDMGVDMSPISLLRS